jgi:tRNA-splicing ligase RtcB
MAKLKLSGKELRAIGYPEGPVISVAMQVMQQEYKHGNKEEVFELLKKIKDTPEDYMGDEKLRSIAHHFIPPPPPDWEVVELKQEGVPFSIFGSDHIEEGALKQMYTAAKIPVAVAGALMPDAHSGYGLPIGGVLATENAVIPYGVGVDIGCRMCLSIFGMPPAELHKRENYFVRELNEATLFGSGSQFVKPVDHDVIADPAFNEIPFLKGLQDKAWRQLGSSGSGNHFVEFGVVEINEEDEVLGLPAGEYLGLLSHSGSRGLGATIANHFTKIAKDKRRLPSEASNLAWLYLDEEEGAEYWIAMNLAGDYASACHHIIHEKIAAQLGEQPIRRVENHHNFAWKEMVEGKEVIVHRKGATPAGKNVLGIIPGSMTADGFIVKGKGEQASLSSASHGAGRKMSRTAALQSVTEKAMKEILERYGVKLIGGGLDESPFAYKDIEMVMKSQQVLVDVVGRFTPKIVKMDGAKHKSWGRKSRME